MARPENLLTAKQVEAALRKGISIQLNDGGGLYFAVTDKNRGSWFMRGRLNGVSKRRFLAINPFRYRKPDCYEMKNGRH